MPTSTLEFLSHLRTLNVRVFHDGDRLRYSAPSGAMTPVLREELAARKAEIIEFLQSAQDATRAGTIARISREGFLPLSYEQRRLWLLQQLEPDSSAYNLAGRFRLKRPLNTPALERSLNELIARHEVLRSYFVSSDGQPEQRIAPPSPLSLYVIDLQELEPPAREAEAERLFHSHATQVFDLGKAPLVSAELLRLTPEEHLFLLSFHHVAFDGWSWGILARELSALYNAFVEGSEPSLAPLPVQYADFAAWQNGSEQVERFERQLQYWTRNLGGELPLLELPADHPRSPVQTANGATLPFIISKELTDSLKALSQQEGVPFTITLLAAFNVLLLRYTGQHDLLVGTPAANRTRTELERLIGCFLNTLVLRCNLSGNPTFRELLHRVQRTATDAYAHQDVPFEKLVETLNPVRDRSRTPLFQVMFSMQSAGPVQLELAGMEPSTAETYTAGAPFDLTFTVGQVDPHLRAGLSYKTDLFEQETILRMVAHFERLLEGIADDPDLRLNQLPLLTSAEESQLIAWNQTYAEYPATATIPDLVRIQARRRASAIAVEFGGQTLTYASLDERSDAFAAHLRQSGVRRGTLVGVCLERGLDLATALLGILKTGGAYLPLDLTFPRDRLAFMIADAKPAVLVTQEPLKNALPAHDDLRLSFIDSFDKAPQTHAVGAMDTQPDDARSDDLAYILYTSGSTGKPKGVEISHRAVVNFLTSMRKEPGLHEDDVLLSVTTLSFDIFGLELWLPLTTGAKVVILSRQDAMDGANLSRAIHKNNVTVMQATPSTWRLLLDSGWQGKPDLKILCGGEAWSKELADRLLPRCSSLWNMYGPTETTIWSAIFRVQKDQPVLIGRPIANTLLYVIDSHLQPLPFGVPGELLIGGDGLARGYLNHPELTAEKFIPNPFSADAQSRLYRTGDLVRRRADGALEFLGRLDHQVKLRGFRIELGDIESCLRAQPEVGQAIVYLHEGGGEKILAAYVVLATGCQLGAATLRERLRRELPDYMVPQTFVFLSAFPLTPNGKIDRTKLPPPKQTQEAQDDAGEETGDVLELKLMRIWEKVLRTRIGPTDDFFDLGGHSFTAVRLMNEIDKMTGRTHPLAMLFQASTVRAMATLLRKEGWMPSWSSIVPIQPRGAKAPLFLVHGAEGNVLLYQQLTRHLGHDQPVYGIQSQGLAGKSEIHTSISQMAAYYVKELQTVQPHGPYQLGGYCLGGTIALEMAQQLMALGETVKIVIMLDTYNSNSISPSVAKLPAWLFSPLYVLQNILFHVANILSLTAEERKQFLAQKLDIAISRIGVRWRHLLNAFKRPAERDSYPHLRVKTFNDQAAFRYAPRKYSGAAAIIRSRGHFWGLASESLGWQGVIKDLAIYTLPVYPKGMLIEPFCRCLSDQMRDCLNETKQDQEQPEQEVFSR